MIQGYFLTIFVTFFKWFPLDAWYDCDRFLIFARFRSFRVSMFARWIQARSYCFEVINKSLSLWFWAFHIHRVLVFDFHSICWSPAMHSLFSTIAGWLEIVVLWVAQFPQNTVTIVLWFFQNWFVWFYSLVKFQIFSPHSHRFLCAGFYFICGECWARYFLSAVVPWSWYWPLGLGLSLGLVCLFNLRKCSTGSIFLTCSVFIVPRFRFLRFSLGWKARLLAPSCESLAQFYHFLAYC